MVLNDHLDTAAGAKVYSPLALRIYDFWVLGISNQYAWRAPTKSVLLPFFKQHLSAQHLDVGVGTGYYLHHAGLRPGQAVSLLDLNGNSLQAASQRMPIKPANRFQGDVLKSGPMPQEQQFSSMSLFYLLHCLPGNLLTKGQVFANLKPYLAEGGVIYGATILGDDADHNAFGRKLMNIYNAKGIFGNRTDTLEGLRLALSRHFTHIDIMQKGVVALFAAK